MLLLPVMCIHIYYICYTAAADLWTFGRRPTAPSRIAPHPAFGRVKRSWRKCSHRLRDLYCAPRAKRLSYILAMHDLFGNQQLRDNNTPSLARDDAIGYLSRRYIYIEFIE